MTDLVLETELKKRYLKRYRKNRALINRLKNKVENLDDRIKGLRSPTLSDMPRGGTPITKEDIIAEKDEIIRRIKRLEVKGRVYKSEILDKIDELEDPRYAEVLESYFVDCKSLEIIADENGYTMRHIIRLYSKGINEITLECQ